MKRCVLMLVILSALALAAGEGLRLVTTVSGAPAANLTSLLPGAIERISVNTGGGDPNDVSGHVSMSTDGCLVAFSSNASNLMTGDNNGELDVFVRDRCAIPAVTERVSVSSAEQEGAGSSWEPVMSETGRYVAFSSAASNLVAGDTNGVTDIFVRDRTAGLTTRISIGDSGVQGNGLSLHPAITPNGRYVAFASEATNLMGTEDTNGVKDVFLYDQQTGNTQRVSLMTTGQQSNGASDNPSVSKTGCYVAFESVATNLVTGDTNVRTDVFVRNRCTGPGSTIRVSVSTAGAQGDQESYDAVISADGCYVAFESEADNLAGQSVFKHVYVHNLCVQPATTVRVSVNRDGASGNADSGDPSIAVLNGCYFVAFESWAGNLDLDNTEDVNPPISDTDSDIFIRDQCANTTGRVSIHNDSLPEGFRGEEDSVDPALVVTVGGQFIAFKSRTSDLIVSDTNGEADVFFWED